ncbi:MAG TPA: DUF2269 family protein [Gemmatimonadales bacterium]
MSTTYLIFKFLHVAAVIVWLGGLLTVGVIEARTALSGDRGVMAHLVHVSAWHGPRVIGPAAFVTLVAGMAMLMVSPYGFGNAWVIWGLAALILSVGIGAELQRRAGLELEKRLEAGTRGDQRIGALHRRLARLNLLNVLVLASAVWVMVFKP